jgi:oligosaccharide repeat unit polymerase
VFVLYKIDYLNFIEVSDQTLGILFVMIVCFPLGVVCGISNKYKILIGSNKQRKTNCQFQLRENLFVLLCIITIVVMFIDELSIILSLINGKSFYSILRDAGGKGTVTMNGAVQVTLYLFIVHPVTYMISPLTAVLFVNNHEKKIRYLILNIIVVALAVAHHGGRNAIYIMLISYILAFFIYDKKAKFQKRTKIFMGVMLMVVLVLINLISASRGFDKIGTSFYAYFTCGIPLMQIYLGGLSFSTPYLGGYLSLNGYTYPFFAILNFLGIESPNLYKITQTVRYYVEDNYVSIGQYSHNMNSFMPAGGYLYFDGGYLFEIVGMLFYGFLLGLQYKKVLKYQDQRASAFYILLCIGLILSFTKLWFTTYGYAIAAVYILLLFKRSNEQNNETRQ